MPAALSWTRVIYTVLFEAAEDGGYVAFCAALPGLVTEGDPLYQAREHASEAIAGYLESVRKDGLPIPVDETVAYEPLMERIRIALPA